MIPIYYQIKNIFVKYIGVRYFDPDHCVISANGVTDRQCRQNPRVG